jgi:hypothetical protein
VGKYRKKPVIIDAIHWTGENIGEALAFLGQHDDPDGEWSSFGGLTIFTLEGPMHASPGDWIIRGVKGEHYACKPDIFEATYEPV